MGSPMLAAAAVVASLGLALASTVKELGGTWSFLSDQHRSYADLTRDQPNVVPEFQSLIPVAAADFFFENMRRDDRYYLQVQPGTFFTGVDLPTAVRTFGRFYLLPAVQVRDPREADVVLSVGADPRKLGLTYQGIATAEGGRYHVARIR
jgi:hypothetical protein